MATTSVSATPSGTPQDVPVPEDPWDDREWDPWSRPAEGPTDVSSPPPVDGSSAWSMIGAAAADPSTVGATTWVHPMGPPMSFGPAWPWNGGACMSPTVPVATASPGGLPGLPPAPGLAQGPGLGPLPLPVQGQPVPWWMGAAPAWAWNGAGAWQMPPGYAMPNAMPMPGATPPSGRPSSSSSSSASTSAGLPGSERRGDQWRSRSGSSRRSCWPPRSF